MYYGGVEWLNISDFLGKIKKGLELHAMCFVFKTAVVFLCKERLRQKKKSLIVRKSSFGTFYEGSLSQGTPGKSPGGGGVNGASAGNGAGAGGSGSSAAEVEIIRYQVLIPVGEVQVRSSSVKDVDGHYLWELIHMKNGGNAANQTQGQNNNSRRGEKVYHLSNR